jgi:LysR family hydrogen peroxide-inducible transcriptional activator
VYRPFAAPVPDRRIALVWRKSYHRATALETLRQSILACGLPGVHMLNARPELLH